MNEYGFTITNAGRVLLTKMLSGSQLTITKVMVGDGKLSGQNPAALNDLISPKYPATATVPKVTDETVTFIVQYQNQETDMVTINEYGVFAQDPDAGEILLYYATLGDYPQYVMPGQGDIRRFPVSIALSANDVEVNLAFDSSAFINAKDLDTKVSKSGDTMTGGIDFKLGDCTLTVGYGGVSYRNNIHSMDKEKKRWKPLAISCSELTFPNNSRITSLATPTDDYDAANKKYVDSRGKRTCRFVVGTSTAGWTAADCDYLCDGTDDQVEINNAISALPSTGGEIIVLAGTYNITGSINVNKSNVKLRGNDFGTLLKITTSNQEYTINVLSDYCYIVGFAFEGKNSNSTIFVNSSFSIIERCYIKSGGSDNQKGHIRVNSGSSNIIQNNFCNSLGIFIYLAKDSNNTIVSNNMYYYSGNASGFSYFLMANFEKDNSKAFTCVNNRAYFYTTTSLTYYSSTFIRVYNAIDSIISNNYGESFYRGIEIYNIFKSTITGNVIQKALDTAALVYLYNSVFSGNALLEAGSRGISMSKGEKSIISDNVIYVDTYASNQYSISFASETENNLISDNLIFGKNYTNSGTGNTFVNNKYN